MVSINYIYCITTVNTYAYNNQNRLTDITTKVNNSIVKVTSFVYDNNGNQLTTTVKTYVNGSITTTKVTMNHTYDYRNQLIETKEENGTITKNEYNEEGYRVVKEVDGEKTYYLYEADKVVLELDSEGSQIARNVYGTNLLMRDADNTTYYFMYNGHADVVALIKENGTIAVTYYYDAFGNILDSTGYAKNNILYAGYQYDKETGLYYLNARMYDPKIARFVQEDTYLGDKNDPLSLNLYTYCHNSPIKYSDPTGHFIVNAISDFIYKTVKNSKQGKWVSKKSKELYDTVDKKAPIATGIYDALYDEVKGFHEIYKLTDPVYGLKKIYNTVSNPKPYINKFNEFVEFQVKTKTTPDEALGILIGREVVDYADMNLIHGNAHTRAEFGTHAVIFIASLFIGGASVSDDAARFGDDLAGVGDNVLNTGDDLTNIADDVINHADDIKCGSKSVDDIIESVENGDVPLANNLQKGNYGEMKMDQYYESQGYKRISVDKVTDLNSPSHQGIDGVYYNPDGYPPYVIAEAKYGSAKLGNTRDGMQMSDTWINGSDRLVNAVGKDAADDILLEGYGKTLVNVSPDGTISIKNLD